MIKFKNLLLSCVAVLALNTAVHAEQEYTDAQIAEMINNPLGNLWLLFIQNDYKEYGGTLTDTYNDGENHSTNVTLIQPVMPMQIGDNLKLIFRPVLPIISAEVPTGCNYGVCDPARLQGNILDESRYDGIGDVVLWTALATNDMARPPEVFGFGMTTMLDTASRDELGLGKYSAGPMALAVHVGEDWIYGVVAQHWWSFAGESDRDNVNLSDVQYILRYRYSKDTNIGMSPNIQYNWSSQKHADRLTLPIGGGFDTLIKLGPLPVKIGVEYYNYVKTPDAYGPKWQVRFYFSPIIPSPGWSKKPLFNF